MKLPTRSSSSLPPYRPRLSFGIRPLDDLICRANGVLPIDLVNDPYVDSSITNNDERHFEGYSVSDKGSLTACICGPDGTGKSVLALHAISQYLSNSLNYTDEPPIVLYISTDLSSLHAKGAWNSFGLDNPHERLSSIPIWIRPREPVPATLKKHRLQLISYEPLSDELAKVLVKNEERPKYSFLFIDLETATTGDDWTYILRLISALTPSHSRTTRLPLLVIDSTDSLEFQVGPHDSFGEKRTRESRLKQLIRTAKKTCHLILVSQEPPRFSSIAEQYATDLVIRLRAVKNDGYSRRTIEIEKARGVGHIRGEHDLFIKDGRGSFTEDSVRFPNPDDPICHSSRSKRFLSYIDVVPSIDFEGRVERESPRSLSRNTSESEQNGPVLPRTSFGIPFLDGLFDESHFKRSSGLVTALIGENATYKSRLARAFLSQAVVPLGDIPPISVFLSSQPTNRKQLIDYFERSTKLSDLSKYADRIICRQLPTNHLTAAEFLQIVKRNVRYAIFKLGEMTGRQSKNIMLLPIHERRRYARYIRLVIDDWRDLEFMHPDIKENHILLPNLVQFLESEGIATLLVETTPANTAGRDIELQPSTLSEHAKRHIYTWRVPFFGEKRVAITARSTLEDKLPLANFELHPYRSIDDNKSDPESLVVDPHFDMYSGIQEGNPQRVPLEVKIMIDPTIEHKSRYYNDIVMLFDNLFVRPAEGRVIKTVDEKAYEQLRDYAALQDGTRLDATFIFQVDEFWCESRKSLGSLKEYLLADPNDEHHIEDHYRLFRKCASTVSRAKRDNIHNPLRAHSFSTHTENNYVLYEKNGYKIDKSPYIWDFGFLLADRDAWKARRIAKVYPGDAGLTIGEIWRSLCPYDIETGVFDVNWSPKIIEWPDFFLACELIADERGFDLDLRVGESFSCFVLEVWASEINRYLRKTENEQTLKNPFRSQRHDGYGLSLRDILVDQKYVDCLFTALSAIGRFCGHLSSENHEFCRRAANERAVSQRHWYSTACDSAFRTGNLLPMRLPGNSSTRGDWFLAMAKGSRSSRLGYRAIDLLSSRRAALGRLRDGIGLPVRDMIKIDEGDTIGDDGRVSTALRRSIGVKDWNDGYTSPYIPYSELLTLGSVASHEDHLKWIWRSTIRNYDVHSRAWTRWLSRTWNHRSEMLWIDVERSSQSIGWVNPGVVERWLEFADEDAKRLKNFRSSVEDLRRLLQACEGDRA